MLTFLPHDNCFFPASLASAVRLLSRPPQTRLIFFWTLRFLNSVFSPSPPVASMGGDFFEHVKSFSLIFLGHFRFYCLRSAPSFSSYALLGLILPPFQRACSGFLLFLSRRVVPRFVCDCFSRICVAPPTTPCREASNFTANGDLRLETLCQTSRSSVPAYLRYYLLAFPFPFGAR